MDLEIIEPIQNYKKEFKTVDEFNLYYSKNKDDIDSLTTHKLNKMYHIDGYRITKIKGKLCLKKWIDKDKDKNEKNSTTNKCDISELKNEIKQLKVVINKIIEYINQNSTLVLPPEIT